MKSTKTTLQYLLLLFAVLFAYGNEWAPYYVQIFSGSDSLRVMGRIDQWRQPCDLASTGGMICTDRYLIPKHALNDQYPNPAVGLGMIISATEVRCTNSDSGRVVFGRDSGAASVMELLKTYQVANLKDLNCRGDLEVTAWSPGMYHRAGYLGSPAVIGNIEHVRVVKRLVEFFSTYLYFLLSLVLIAVWAITTRVVSPLLEEAKAKSSFDPYLYAWIGFALIKSGLAELMFPLLSKHLLFARLSNYFALLAYFGPALLEVANTPVIPRSMVRGVRWLESHRLIGFIRPIHIAFALLCISPYFGTLYGPIFTALVALIAYQVAITRDQSLGIYGLVLAIDVAKLFNWPIAPDLPPRLGPPSMLVGFRSTALI